MIRNFLELCELHDWRVAFYQAHPEHLPKYRALGLHAFKLGEEAILNPQTFTLSGSAMANVRTSCRRAERDGVIIQWYDAVPPKGGPRSIAVCFSNLGLGAMTSPLDGIFVWDCISVITTLIL